MICIFDILRQAIYIQFDKLFSDEVHIKRYKKAKIRKRRNQIKIPTLKTEVGKNQTNNQVLIP